MIYAVIDTNVFVSANITTNTQVATFQLVEKLLSGEFIPVYNEEILREYTEVLNRSKFKILPSAIKHLLDHIIKNGISVSRTPFPQSMPDEKDRVFYEVSLNKEGSYLVTGNLKHFPATHQVVTPAEMLAILNNQ